ncbi:unnamed protein product [Bursaphelenchus xylophilus]|uniref:(pine wood nematode) hypothetical protein n=1 Tax=Bursaphelenchus xylophilus TaxID=6326 RepID=A0A1I7RQ69_BURXY|nr:unnamed protein product [Bursaphelenchus xylophilus]CAG9097248.1 unnamed protein product [Bursaphelenchus xylophilus]
MEKLNQAEQVVTLSIKASVSDLEAMESKIFAFTESIGHLATQQDTYFNVPYGQLKLRKTYPNKEQGELISAKSISHIPHLVETRATRIHEASALKKTLELCISELGTIKKKRRVYVKDNVRINLDDVEGLGVYVDVEIKKDATNDVEKQAVEVKKALGITDDMIVTSNYLELYRKRKSADSGFDDETSDASL